jgi:hypothetical protein
MPTAELSRSCDCPPSLRASGVMQLAAAAPAVVVKTLPVIVHTGGSDLTTTILATVGVVLAVASLVWQAWTFRLSGSRVSVRLRSGMRDLANTAAVTGPDHMSTDQELRLRTQGFTHPVLAVEVKNSGRSPTSVQSVSIQFANGAVYTESHFDPALPSAWRPNGGSASSPGAIYCTSALGASRVTGSSPARGS